MLFLLSQDIIALYAWVDDALPKRIVEERRGRPLLISDAEMVTILIWNILLLKQKTWKDLHRFLLHYHAKDFPHLPKYSAFILACHRATMSSLRLLQCLLNTDAPVKILDGTMLPVCKHKRADSHRVARGIADFGKNWQGWHFGFKLHASVDRENKLCAIAFTPANVHEKHLVPHLLGKTTRIAVADLSYGGKELRERIWKTKGTFILTTAFPGQKQKIVAPWQLSLLAERSKIESVFDYLKEHLHLVTSFPRSVFGYLAHYVMVLLGYQVLKLCGN